MNALHTFSPNLSVPGQSQPILAPNHSLNQFKAAFQCRTRCFSLSAATAGSSSSSRQTTTSLACSASMYDNPAIYSNDDAFAERLYWDKRYQQDPTTFEWYRSYDSLKAILTQ